MSERREAPTGETGALSVEALDEMFGAVWTGAKLGWDRRQFELQRDAFVAEIRRAALRAGERGAAGEARFLCVDPFGCHDEPVCSKSCRLRATPAQQTAEPVAWLVDRGACGDTDSLHFDAEDAIEDTRFRGGIVRPLGYIDAPAQQASAPSEPIEAQPRMSLEEFAEKNGLTMVVRERSIASGFPLGHPSRWFAHFDGAEVAERGMLVGVHGNGVTPAAAIAHYAERISERRLVIDALKTTRREIIVPVLRAPHSEEENP